MKVNLPVTGREVKVGPTANILSTTDIKGTLTYANAEFIQISGFGSEELLYKNHNVVRHPDIPAAVFGQMWDTIKSGKSWLGLIKNRCKSGDHYHVHALVSPIKRGNEIVEFQSVRTQADPARVARAEQVYAAMRNGRTGLPGFFSRIGLGLRLNLASGAGLLVAASVAWALGAPILAVLAFFLIAGVGQIAASILLLAPLRRLAAKARAVSDSTLNQYVFTGRLDEIGQIEFALVLSQIETNAVVARLSDSTLHLSENAESLVAAVEHSSTGNRQQQNETDLVATAITEMAASVQEVARNAQATAEAADQADQAAGEGKDQVLRTSGAIRVLAEEVKKAAAVIDQLDERIQEITKVLQVITEIAEQTNLLALNAAIEAARAGEQGRGFAVVADEVRTLSSRTHKSTQEIHLMIEKLQSAATSAVHAMEASRQHAEVSVDEAATAAQSLDHITQSVSTIRDMSAQIATAVEEQSAVGTEIERNIASIRTISDENSRTGGHVETVASELSLLATNLQVLVEQFSRRRLTDRV